MNIMIISFNFYTHLKYNIYNSLFIKKMKNGFIQLAIKGTGLYLVYTCF